MTLCKVSLHGCCCFACVLQVFEMGYTDVDWWQKAPLHVCPAAWLPCRMLLSAASLVPADMTALPPQAGQQHSSSPIRAAKGDCCSCCPPQAVELESARSHFEDNQRAYYGIIRRFAPGFGAGRFLAAAVERMAQKVGHQVKPASHDLCSRGGVGSTQPSGLPPLGDTSLVLVCTKKELHEEGAPQEAN